MLIKTRVKCFHSDRSLIIIFKPLKQQLKITVLLIFLMQSLLLGAVYASEGINETELKAAFSIRLLSYVNIPLVDSVLEVGTKDKIVRETYQPDIQDVCLYPDNPFGNYIKDYVKNFSALKKIKIELHYPEKIEELSKCDLVYLSDVKTKEMNAINELARNYSFLTVGDANEFIHKGGMIELFLKKKRLKFSVNQQATVDAGLKLNTLVLGLAEEVIKAQKDEKVTKG